MKSNLYKPYHAGQAEVIPTLDLDQLMWEEIKAAAEKSSWIPQEYYMNDWVSDVCRFLEGERVNE